MPIINSYNDYLQYLNKKKEEEEIAKRAQQTVANATTLNPTGNSVMAYKASNGTTHTYDQNENAKIDAAYNNQNAILNTYKNIMGGLNNTVNALKDIQAKEEIAKRAEQTKSNANTLNPYSNSVLAYKKVDTQPKPGYEQYIATTKIDPISGVSTTTREEPDTPTTNTLEDYLSHYDGENGQLPADLQGTGITPDTLDSYLANYEGEEGQHDFDADTRNAGLPTPTAAELKTNPTTNPATTSTTTSTETSAKTKAEREADKVKSMWDMYKSQLAQSNVNQKAELAAINQKANSYVNDYIKSLGLSGTSAGASQIAANNLNLANAYSNVNNATQQQLNDYNEQERSELDKINQREEEKVAAAKEELNATKKTNAENLASAYSRALENGESSKYLKKILDSYSDDELPEGTKKYLENYAGTAGTWEGDRSTVLEDIDDQIAALDESGSGLTAIQRNNLNNIIDELENAKDEEEFETLFDKYQKILKDISKVSNTIDISNADNVKGSVSNTETNVVSSDGTSEFGELSTKKKDENVAWVTALQEAAKNGDIPNGTLVNMTFGDNTSKGNIYEYRDGKWYPRTDVAKAKAYSLDDYDGNLVNHIKILLEGITGKKTYSGTIDSLLGKK